MENTSAGRDLFCSRSASVLWCVPVVMLVVGLNWPAGRFWLWIVALAVVGGACVVNARRCGRLHCYITGPVLLLAAVYVVLARFAVVPLNPNRFLLTLFVVSVGACLAELPLGRYAKKA